MPAKSSVEPTLAAGAVERAAAADKLRWPGRTLLLVINYLPLLHAGAVLWLLLAVGAGSGQRLGAALAALYLAPPVFARLILLLVPIPQGHISVGTPAFFGWWALLQLQAVFCRLPALEEALRLVPSLYSLWLRLWGARIGRLTYWAAGTLILDRSFLHIGDDVVFGAGVSLIAHVLARNAQGELELLLATIRIGDRVPVGGYSLLTAGARITDDETTRAFMILPPFSVWRGGRKGKADGGEHAAADPGSAET